MSLLVQGVRLVDEETDIREGWLLAEGGRIAGLGPGSPPAGLSARTRVDGRGLALLPAFVELHAHFRDPGRLDKEVLESGCLAAAAGGYGTVVVMANTQPAMSDPETALSQRRRASALGLVDLYPALSMSRDLGGLEASHLELLAALRAGPRGEEARLGLRILSEDGRDLEDEGLYLEILRRAAALDLLVSCHCEAAGAPDSRLAELRGVERALRLGRAAGCRLHIAHVSTADSLELLGRAKAEAQAAARAEVPGRVGSAGGFRPSCEASPHHLVLTAEDADRLGSFAAGKVNPPLRSEEDRKALIRGLLDGTIDAIATDHAPHRPEDKAEGAPGFSGLETAFGILNSEFGQGSGAGGGLGLAALSRLLSASPAHLLGLGDRGRLEPGLRADLVLLDSQANWSVDPSRFKSRGGNSPFASRELRGRILMTIQQGRIVHDEL